MDLLKYTTPQMILADTGNDTEAIGISGDPIETQPSGDTQVQAQDIIAPYVP